MPRLATVFIADPDDAARAELGTWLRAAGLRLVGEAVTVPGARLALDACRPDAVVVGLGLPGAVLQLVGHLADRKHVPVVVRHRDPRARLVVDAVLSGASGFIPYGPLQRSSLECLSAVMRGESAFPPALVDVLVAELRLLELEVLNRRRGGPHLTEREWDVVELLRRGCSTADIARALGVAPVTVRTHIAAVMHRLQVSTRSELLAVVSRMPGSVLRDLNADLARADSAAPATLLPSQPSGS